MGDFVLKFGNLGFNFGALQRQSEQDGKPGELRGA